MNSDSRIKVNLSLKRVQTFIFDVPRLKAMLGANALIGETLRLGLTERAIACGATPVSADGAPSADAFDPLQSAEQLERDDPAWLLGQGILARDGGHFSAVFASKAGAMEFCTEAENLLAEALPGVLFEIEMSAIDGQSLEEPKALAKEAFILELPVLQICQETGREVASKKCDKGSWAASSVQHRMDAGDRFHAGKTRDIIGLMRRPLGLDQEAGWQAPRELEELCDGQYLALIHADGNGVGKRYKSHRSSCTHTGLAKECHGERFFHSMRVAVRRAVVQALTEVFQRQQGVRPYEVLMLGGDDLLLACRADMALPFAQAYAQALTNYPLADGQPLSVGIGVAIAKHSYPLHRLHALAEALAASAKRLYRAAPEHGSVIDWQIVTQSWFGDLQAQRRSAELRRYRVGDTEESLLLSRRPYAVPGQDGLEGLLAAVVALSQRDQKADTILAARTPLRALRTAFETGRLAGEMAFSRLDEGVRAILTGESSTSPWVAVADHCYQTRVLDIVELSEIARLGRRNHD